MAQRQTDRTDGPEGTDQATQPGYDVLVVGGSGVDTVVRVDSLPVPLADSVGVGPILEWPGHTGGNVALGCRRLGLDVKFLDFIGDDGAGEQVRERLTEGDVDFETLISPAGTRRAVNFVEKTGRRMSFFDARDPADLRMPREFYLPHLRRARHVHLSITNFARHLFDDIHELGVHWPRAERADGHALAINFSAHRFGKIGHECFARGVNRESGDGQETGG